MKMTLIVVSLLMTTTAYASRGPNQNDPNMNPTVTNHVKMPCGKRAAVKMGEKSSIALGNERNKGQHKNGRR